MLRECLQQFFAYDYSADSYHFVLRLQYGGGRGRRDDNGDSSGGSWNVGEWNSNESSGGAAVNGTGGWDSAGGGDSWD